MSAWWLLLLVLRPVRRVLFGLLTGTAYVAGTLIGVGYLADYLNYHKVACWFHVHNGIQTGAESCGCRYCPARF